MADMSREEAERVLDEMMGRLLVAMATKPCNKKSLERDRGYIDALKAGKSALRGWVKTADRLPAVEDGIIGATGEPEVLAVTRYAHGYFPDMKMVSEICIPLGSKYYPYWMPLPKLPEVEG